MYLVCDLRLSLLRQISPDQEEFGVYSEERALQGIYVRCGSCSGLLMENLY